ncbi:DUF6095 family protein [Winogradskyella eckloniae]|uniref:DUF6095 family protein n=1 Tax=Winogradskyella eckloniae TaxID=1089306 RepID=UPI00293BD1F3|nr:DUF6095 family protein [Winogradskyella eckloniae]
MKLKIYSQNINQLERVSNMENNNNKTDKDILTKGLKQLVICLIFMFLGPTMLHIAFSNNDKPLYLVILILSIILCLLAIVFLAIGINTIMNSMFHKKK